MPKQSTAHARRSLPFSAGAPMSIEQAALLKKLAHDAYEPEAYKAHLTQAEARRRIAMLSAKLPLLDGPPHTL
jgi:hypothetical protein